MRDLPCFAAAEAVTAREDRGGSTRVALAVFAALIVIRITPAGAGVNFQCGFPSYGTTPNPAPRTTGAGKTEGRTDLVVLYAVGSEASSDAMPTWARAQWDSTTLPSVPSYYEEVSTGKLHLRGWVYGQTDTTCFRVNVVTPPGGSLSAFCDSLVRVADPTVDFGQHAEWSTILERWEAHLAVLAPSGWGAGYGALGGEIPTADSLEHGGRMYPVRAVPNFYMGTGSRPIMLGASCHEFGHNWFWDHYTCSEPCTDWWCNTCGVGSFDIMASGGFGTTNVEDLGHPSYFTPYNREQLEWLNPVEVQSSLYAVEIPDITTGAAYKLRDARDPGQAFLVTSHRKRTYYEETWPGEGLMIWHVHPARLWAGSAPEERTGLWSGWQILDRTVCQLCAAQPDTNYRPDPVGGRDSLDLPPSVWQGRTGAGGPSFYFRPDVGDELHPFSNPNSNFYGAPPCQSSSGQALPTRLGVRNIQTHGPVGTIVADLLVDEPLLPPSPPDYRVSADTTWGPGPMQARYVVVEPGARLRLLPGTQISFEECPDAGIWVDGELTAAGTPSDSIVLNGPPGQIGWAGVVIRGAGTDTLRFCKVMGSGNQAGGGIRLEGASASVLVTNCKVLAAAPALRIAQTSGPVTVTDCAFNATTIGVEQYGTSGPVTLRNCRIDAATAGVSLSGLVADTRISGCQIRGNETGVAINGCAGTVRCSALTCSGAMEGVRVESSPGPVEIEHSVFSDCFTGATMVGASAVRFERCNLSYNGYGLYSLDASPVVVTSKFIGNGTGVLATAASTAVPNLGDLLNEMIDDDGLNCFDNLTFDVDNQSAVTVMAQGDWWGESPPDPSRIRGPVNYDYWTTECLAPPTDVPPGERSSTGPILALRLSTSNPGSPPVRIALGLPVRGDVRLEVFDVRGRRVRTVASGVRQAGESVEVWDGNDAHGGRVSSGIYYLRLEASSRIIARKVVVVQ